MNLTELTQRMDQYKWYHLIKVADGVYTPGIAGDYRGMWEFNLRALNDIDFTDKKVLDVGCRDGLFSFEAERRGAREIVAIDNDLSPGATELLIPYFNSKVRMYEMNLMDLTPDRFGTFDIILFFGVLYHLRYPVWGLRKLIDCLADGGTMGIETGMLVDPRYQNFEFLYCPVEDSPYEPTSCTFFNQKALDTTMRSLGCEAIDCKTLGKDLVETRKPALREIVKDELRKFKPVLRPTGPQVTRQLLTYRKNVSRIDDHLLEYWDSTHGTHTEIIDNGENTT